MTKVIITHYKFRLKTKHFVVCKTNKSYFNHQTLYQIRVLLSASAAISNTQCVQHSSHSTSTFQNSQTSFTYATLVYAIYKQGMILQKRTYLMALI